MFGLYMRSDRSSPTLLGRDRWSCTSLLGRSMLTPQLSYCTVKFLHQHLTRLDSSNAWYPRLPR